FYFTELHKEVIQFIRVVNNISSNLYYIQILNGFIHNSSTGISFLDLLSVFILCSRIFFKTICAAYTLFSACLYIREEGLSRTESGTSTFLLTGRQCITFALLVIFNFLGDSIQSSVTEGIVPY